MLCGCVAAAAASSSFSSCLICELMRGTTPPQSSWIMDGSRDQKRFFFIFIRKSPPKILVSFSSSFLFSFTVRDLASPKCFKQAESNLWAVHVSMITYARLTCTIHWSDNLGFILCLGPNHSELVQTTLKFLKSKIEPKIKSKLFFNIVSYYYLCKLIL